MIRRLELGQGMIGTGFIADTIQKYKNKVGASRFATEIKNAPPFQPGENEIDYQYRTGLPMAIPMYLKFRESEEFRKSSEGRALQNEVDDYYRQQEREAKLTPAQKKKREEATKKAFEHALNTGVAEQVASKAKGYVDTASKASPLLGKLSGPAGAAYDAAKFGLDIGYNLMGIPEDQSNEASTARGAAFVSDVRNRVDSQVKSRETRAKQRDRLIAQEKRQNDIESSRSKILQL